jgi:hypothetical protein
MTLTSDSSSTETIIFTKSTERHFRFLQATLAQLNLNFASAAHCASRIEQSSFYFILSGPLLERSAKTFFR